MKMKIMNEIHTIGFPDYRIEIGNARFALIDPLTGHVLFAAASPILLRPEFHGKESAWIVEEKVSFAENGKITASVAVSTKIDLEQN